MVVSVSPHIGKAPKISIVQFKDWRQLLSTKNQPGRPYTQEASLSS